ncbi:serine/threonine-protein kinase [uncultured Jatrophihabitans sp.]|uniref:serine/threonine-protein kinase n=1 Tax=uncultured Jatrophihabitans sp. TaxID=1610747 RepID=UPI0035CBE02C
MRRSKPAPQHDFFPGFTDVAEIGVGSLATVYRARETGTNRFVALKLLNIRDASPRALESFERESIALGAVSSHPNIVTLYRSFRAADGRPVLVLELCRGSIGDRMHGGAGLPAAGVVALGIKIAGALETAHRAEILHRDVKPQNILLTEFGEPALADFGVAMLQSSTQTTAGLFDFTTLHAAPELLEGGETSAATDVYELASTLYQLIAGRAAFRAYEGESPAAVILRILRDPVQPLVNTQAPTSLSDLLLYAMSKEKSSRPPTAAEFAAELATIEVEQQWPRTQFLIRDASGGTSGLPTITRMPDVGRRAAGLVAAPLLPPPTGRPLAGPQPVPPLVDPRPTNERVVVERQVIERLVFERPPVARDGWSEVSIVHVHPDQSPTSADEVPADEEPANEVALAGPPQPWAPPPPLEVTEAELVAAARLEAERERMEAERLERERVEAERVEAERVEAERVEAERRAAERVEAERVEAERVEAERVEAERIEPARSATARHAEPEPEPEPDPVPVAEPDFAAIWGDLAELPSAPPPLAPPSPPPSAFHPPPDPATRIDRPVGEPQLDVPFQPAEPIEPVSEPLEPAESETPLPFVPWRGAVAEPDPFDTGEHEVDPTLAAGGAPADGQPAQYPIPPAGVPNDASVETVGGTGTVPTWAFRAATQAPAGPASYGDLALDPMSLRNKVSLRAGTSSLVVDDSGLAVRMRMRKSSIPWGEVLGFEPRFDEGGRAARLVALTHSGPVELAATHCPAGEVRYIHALLDAYRQRAAILGSR